MKKKFKVEGIDCPNCAAKVEKLVGEIEGVTSSKLNFMAEKLTVEAEDSMADTLLEKVSQAVRSVESDAVIEML